MSYVDDLADAIRSALPRHLVPDSDADLLFRLYAVLALAKGEAVSSEDVHDAWTAWMSQRGLAHRSMVPFDELTEAIRREDDPFVVAIRSAVQERERSRGLGSDGG